MKVKFFISLVIVATLSINLLAEDGEQKENFLYRVYQKYHAQPTDQEVWEKALSQRPSQEYTIIKGDTLWDVSRTLFGDGFFWSKVWSLNPFITNPHLISVKQVIHFYPGSGLESPGLQVNTTAITPMLSPQTSLSKTQWWKSQNLPTVPLELGDVTIPPPGKIYPPVLESFPSSLPSWYFQTDSEIDQTPLEILPPDVQEVINILNLPYFISEYPQNVKGIIFEIEKSARTASERDYLFIDGDEELKIGSIYTVIQPIGKIRDPEVVGDPPKAYEVQGEITIVGQVEGLYKALVTKALFPIQIGAMVVPGPGPKMDLSDSGEPAKIQGMIVGGENDTTRALFGPQSIVYINRGSGDGVKVNQKAPIMAVHRLRHTESSIFSNTWKLGEIKVVKVETNYSTAVVMTATEGIMPGDIIGELRPSDLTENFKLLDGNTEFGDDDESSPVSLEQPKLKERGFDSEGGRTKSGSMDENFDSPEETSREENTSSPEDEFDADLGDPGNGDNGDGARGSSKERVPEEDVSPVDEEMKIDGNPEKGTDKDGDSGKIENLEEEDF